MKKLSFLLLIIISFTVNAQLTIDGITLPKKVSVGKTELILNGGGIREKYWIDLYVSGLYLKTKSTDAKAVINNDEEMTIKLVIVSSLISSKKMIAAVDEGFEKSTHKNTAPLKNEIEQFKDAFKEEITKGNTYDIVYFPAKQLTIVLKDGKLKAKIEGLEFKKALWGIWFGDEPAEEDLKNAMLGKS